MSKVVFFGRSNVGKSSVFNAIVGKNIAVVGEIENLTNDPTRFVGQNVTVFDTPGVSKIEDLKLVESKIGNFDTACIVIEPNMSIELEKKILAYFKNKECIFVLNKADTDGEFVVPSIESIPVSAISGQNIDLLRRRIGFYGLSKKLRKIFLIGRSNVGKSSIGNYLLGINRFKVVDEIGTTRDLVGEDFGSFELFDTPGYRKNNNLNSIEKASQYRLERLIQSKETGCVVMVVDASIGLTKGDRILIDKLLESFVVVICVNKVDLVPKNWLLDIVKEIKRIYPNLVLVEVSAKTGEGMYRLRAVARDFAAMKLGKIKTSYLNKWLRMQKGFEFIKYITQKSPTSFIVFSKRRIDQHQLRFLERSLLSYLNLNGVRIKIEVVLE